MSCLIPQICKCPQAKGNLDLIIVLGSGGPRVVIRGLTNVPQPALSPPGKRKVPVDSVRMCSIFAGWIVNGQNCTSMSGLTILCAPENCATPELPGQTSHSYCRPICNLYGQIFIGWILSGAWITGLDLWIWRGLGFIGTRIEWDQ